nr:hypothetical protein HK105_006854 [Polyrhizophydium stewartii]
MVARKGKRSWRKGYKDPLLVNRPKDVSDAEDADVDEDELAAFQEFGSGNLAFLSELDPRSLLNNYQKQRLAASAGSKVKTSQSAADEDECETSSDEDEDAIDEDDSDAEAAYERVPRVAPASDSGAAAGRLPIKTKTGQLVIPRVQQPTQQPAPGDDMVDSEDDQADSGDDKPNGQGAGNGAGAIGKATPTAAAASSSHSKEKTALPPAKERFAVVREKLANSATLLIEDPEANIGELRSVRNAGDSKDERVVKLALLTQLAVFKDIIPGYRIRKLTEKELSVQVSKEVKRLRNYEEALLFNYQAFLQQLEQFISNLLKSVAHFNYRVNIMTVVVGAMRKVKNPDLLNTCCESFETLFREDETGEASLEAVRLISRFAKQANYQIRGRIIKIFLSLRLVDELHLPGEGAQATTKKRKADREHVSKKMRKINRAHAEIEKEMKEAEATVDREEREKRHSETLKQVFLVYFRILKDVPESALVMPVLEGLGKFAHLINIDFFNDLVNAIKKICMQHLEQASDGSDLSYRLSVSMQCILTVLQLLASVKDAIKIDLLHFHGAMYRIISRLALRVPPASSSGRRATPHADRNCIELMLLVLELMLHRPLDIPVNRLAAFTKRLATMSMSMAESGTIGAMSALHKLLMLKHFHPAVRQSATMVLHHSDNSVARALPTEMRDLARDRPLQIAERYDPFSGGAFVLRPPCRPPPRLQGVPNTLRGPAVMRQSAFMAELERKVD